MEFLLANHPLDCPVCDQGGECDLQDQYFTTALINQDFQKIKEQFKINTWVHLSKLK